MRITWHSYKYYPYERALAARELKSLISGGNVTETDDGFEVAGKVSHANMRRLTYFSSFGRGHRTRDTEQAQLERAVSLGRNRQATRYSVHGLHEYKGKFNPQVAKAILNIFGIKPGDFVLDPFCGSGTTLIECAHLGAVGQGTDLNPMAVFVANAKLLALSSPANSLRKKLEKLQAGSARRKSPARGRVTLRTEYLLHWFDPEILSSIEQLRLRIVGECGALAPVFLVIASNLLRDYSLQDPNDLRIRRRKCPLPTLPFEEAFVLAADQAIARLREAQLILGEDALVGKAIVADITKARTASMPQLFDAAITSPPYAMALPYIDTQRLSLVWLGLIHPNEINPLEATLIGSREMRGNGKQATAQRLLGNLAKLPAQEADFCLTLKNALDSKDGFRRLAVPALLYRYFESMRDSFAAIHKTVKPGAPFALIVGHNHTTLGGNRYDINTPVHLANIAESTGWRTEELFELQTYQRYGYHMSNAVRAETLILLRHK